MTTAPDTLIHEEDTTDDSKVAHIIWGEYPKADITAAIVNGTPLLALCGLLFVPSRDPNKFPVCWPCQKIKDEIMGRP